MPDTIPTCPPPRPRDITAMAPTCGPETRRPGTFAANCLLARRMAERGVRFIQLYHRGWDQHYNLPSDLRLQCRDVDRPAAALVRDLKQRGLLDETLIVWGGADRIIAPAYAQEFASRIACARIEMIEKAGHLPQLEQPEAVARAVLGFLGG